MHIVPCPSHIPRNSEGIFPISAYFILSSIGPDQLIYFLDLLRNMQMPGALLPADLLRTGSAMFIGLLQIHFQFIDSPKFLPKMIIIILPKGGVDLMSVGALTFFAAIASDGREGAFQTVQYLLKGKMKWRILPCKGFLRLKRRTDPQQCAGKGILQHTTDQFRNNKWPDQKPCGIYFI